MRVRVRVRARLEVAALPTAVRVLERAGGLVEAVDDTLHHVRGVACLGLGLG